MSRSSISDSANANYEHFGSCCHASALTTRGGARACSVNWSVETPPAPAALLSSPWLLLLCLAGCIPPPPPPLLRGNERNETDTLLPYDPPSGGDSTEAGRVASVGGASEEWLYWTHCCRATATWNAGVHVRAGAGLKLTPVLKTLAIVDTRGIWPRSLQTEQIDT